jgi:hypothetical protein
MMSLAEPDQNVVRGRRFRKVNQITIVRRNDIDVEKRNANENEAEVIQTHQP